MTPWDYVMTFWDCTMTCYKEHFEKVVEQTLAAAA